MKAYLVLANGQVFEGEAIGYTGGGALGELVFATGMGGYLETLSDPSYYGQIILQTFPLIGNYGFIPEDLESGAIAARGYVVSSLCDTPSNFRSMGALGDWLSQCRIPGIAGVDTREITTILREAGVMNAVITADPDSVDWESLRGYQVKDAVKSVSTRDRQVLPATGEKRYAVALIDYGAKGAIAKQLQARGCEVTVLPYDITAEQILSLKPDGVMLSNGPGDPAENREAIAQLALLTGRVPIFGICLGHQLLALANGHKTYKLKYGHRGVNQPVREKATGRVYITSQNHGYAVSPEGGSGVLAYENANDGTCEGMRYEGKAAFSVQFHPEACSGPLDTRFVFDRFLALMDGWKGGEN